MPSINVGLAGNRAGNGTGPRVLFINFRGERGVDQTQPPCLTRDHTRLDFILFDLQSKRRFFLPTIVAIHIFCCCVLLFFACHNVYSGSSLIVQDWRERVVVVASLLRLTALSVQ